MGVREVMNKNGGIISAVAVTVLIVAVVWIVYQARGPRPGFSTKEWYTTDNGQTWFAEPAGQLPPIMKDGKLAYRVNVYQCGETKFAGYLERWPDEGKKALEAAQAKSGGAPPGALMHMLSEQYLEMKKPADKEWVRMAGMVGSPNAARLKCPDGSGAQPKRVEPW